MEHARQWLRLMQLSSSSLPVGSFTWSQGLEWAVEAGWVANADAFKRWQIQQMEQSFSASICRCFTVSARPAIGTTWRRPNAGRHTCSPVGKRASCAKKNATAERPLRVSSKAGSRTARQNGWRCAGKASSAAWRGSACAGALTCASWR
jgi:hypothetical protein